MAEFLKRTEKEDPEAREPRPRSAGESAPPNDHPPESTVRGRAAEWFWLLLRAAVYAGMLLLIVIYFASGEPFIYEAF